MCHQKRESDRDRPQARLALTPHYPPRRFTFRTPRRHTDYKPLHGTRRRHTPQDTLDLALPHHDVPAIHGRLLADVSD